MLVCTLRNDLQNIFRTLGNTHWADSTDASLLSQALDIGFLIFADRLQANGQRCLGYLNLDRGEANFPYFLALWWSEPIHFRSLEMQATAADPFRSCWNVSEIPAVLRDQYNLANAEAPIP